MTYYILDAILRVEINIYILKIIYSSRYSLIVFEQYIRTYFTTQYIESVSIILFCGIM